MQAERDGTKLAADRRRDTNQVDLELAKMKQPKDKEKNDA